jgi:hypothetical protein
MNENEIRAVFDEKSITVYQAFNKEIAKAAVADQTFIAPFFNKKRMTWIKPSFLWMMYRSGWATKENQENILAIKISREGFEWALANSCLSHFEKDVHSSYEDWKQKLLASPVRVQWDPEKDIFLRPLKFRSIQIGLSGIAVEKYISDWIYEIRDITEYCHEIHYLINNGEIKQASELLPIEKKYPI